jgi:hypothetical protein
MRKRSSIVALARALITRTAASLERYLQMYNEKRMKKQQKGVTVGNNAGVGRVGR